MRVIAHAGAIAAAGSLAATRTITTTIAGAGTISETRAEAGGTLVPAHFHSLQEL